jgi:hypothetical protein
MTREEAKNLGLPERQAWRYSRLADSKENYAPPPELASWYRFENVDLGNSAGLYVEGDAVHVTTVWVPPSPFEGISLNIIAEIFEALRLGPGEGEFYSPDRRAKLWFGRVVMEKAEKNEDEVAHVISTWIENKVLVEDNYHSAKRRKKFARVMLNEAKAAEILGPLNRKPESEE